MPKGSLTEEGPQCHLADLYGAREMPTAWYRARTEQNVRDSDGTIGCGTTDIPVLRRPSTPVNATKDP